MMKTARVLASATALSGGRLLVIGGLSDSKLLLSARGDAELIDLRANPPRLVALPLGATPFSARAGHAALSLQADRVLVAGGDLGGTLTLFEPNENAGGSFRRAGVLPGGARMDLTATRLLDGRVLVAGGLDAGRKSSRATELFDPKSGELIAGPPLGEARHGHTATLLLDGRVLVAGGAGRDTTELYEPQKNRFVAGPRLSHVRDDHSATRLPDGRVLITGGQLDSGRSVATVERFDPRTNLLTGLSDMAADRADHVQLALPDGSVLVIGGESDDGHGHDTILDSVERFDPKTARFETLKPLQTPRDDHAAALLQDGRTIAIAGGQGPGDRALASIELYAVPNE